MKNINYCGFTDTDNIGDYALYLANKILFSDFNLNNHKTSSNINLFGGGTLYPYCLRYGEYPQNKHEFSIGLGVLDPIESGNFGLITKYMMKKRKFKFMGVRGIHSQRILKKYNIDSTITGDTALIHRCDQTVDINLDLIGINFVGESMSRLGSQNKVTKKIIVFCQQAISNGNTIILIPFCQTDITAMLQIKDDLGKNVRILDFWGQNINCDLSKFFIEMKKCSFIVTERLHASIFSAFLGIPFISLAYKSKCFDFIDSLHLDKKIIFNLDAIDNLDLLSEFNKFKDDITLYDEISYNINIFRKKLQLTANNIQNQLL